MYVPEANPSFYYSQFHQATCQSWQADPPMWFEWLLTTDYMNKFVYTITQQGGGTYPQLAMIIINLLQFVTSHSFHTGIC